MVKNAYIHIPFCKSKCHYCSFVSFDKLGLKERYVDALIEQIKAQYKGEELNTLYFGGGTPSLLSIDDIARILALFEFEKNPEITVEVNPDSVDLEYLKALRALGVNRLSIGSQSFSDEILQKIGRRHNAMQIIDAVNSAKMAGFDNVSLDFIYGLPTQGVDDFINDLTTAVVLGVEHISLYGLKIEEGCYFYKNSPKNLPNLDEQADYYLKAVEVLTENGFEHYEISNFSRLGYNSRHNLNYWDNNSYYGFGCAASGYRDGIRYTNQNDLEKYIQNPLGKILEEKLGEQETLEEAIFLGFRKIAGINVAEINQKFGIDFEYKYKKVLEKYNKYFLKTEQGYALNLEGILISIEILSEFIDL